MAEPDQNVLSLTFNTLLHIAHRASIIPWSRSISLPLRLVSLPLKIAYSTIRSLTSYFAGWLAVFFAPALYLLAYVRACCRGIVVFVVALQPLYIFFSTAAVVGIIAGITLAISSFIITTYLGMRADSTSSANEDTPIKKEEAEEISPSSTISPITSEDASSFSSSSIRSESYLVEQSPARRQYTSGLLAQTILEEEDSDDF